MADTLKARMLALQKLVDEMTDDIVAGGAPEEEAPVEAAPVEPDADDAVRPEDSEELKARLHALMNE